MGKRRQDPRMSPKAIKAFLARTHAHSLFVAAQSVEDDTLPSREMAASLMRTCAKLIDELARKCVDGYRPIDCWCIGHCERCCPPHDDFIHKVAKARSDEIAAGDEPKARRDERAGKGE